MVICHQEKNNQAHILITKLDTRKHLNSVYNTNSKLAPMKEEDFLKLENHVSANLGKIYLAHERKRTLRNLSHHQVFNSKIHKIYDSKIETARK